MDYYVEIVKYDGKEIIERMGPMSERKANSVESGANINLNHTDHFVRTVAENVEPTIPV